MLKSKIQFNRMDFHMAAAALAGFGVAMFFGLSVSAAVCMVASAAFLAWAIVHRMELSKAEKDRLTAETDRLRAANLRVMPFHEPLLIVNPDGGYTILTPNQNPAYGAENAFPALTERPTDGLSPLPPVLPILDRSRMSALYGVQGAGKTSILSHLLNIRGRRGEEIVIIDPHGYRGKFPYGEIIGAGRKYAEIDSVFTALMDEIERRYELYEGQEFEPLNIFIDELTLLNQHCENFKTFMRVLLTESRKVGFRAVICTHSNRAEIMGLKGSFDLVEDLVWVRLNHKPETGERWAEIKGERYSLPGPYPQLTGPGAPNASGQGAGRVHEAAGASERCAESEADKMKKFYNEGMSLKEISKKIFGYANGRTLNKIKACVGV